MFIENALIKKVNGTEYYDKFVIASAIFGASFKGVTCSLLEEKVLNNCQSCNLRYLCENVEELIEDYTDKTTKITDSFNFSWLATLAA